MISYVRRRPPLNRLARYLRWSSVLALVLVVLFLISTFVSGIEFASHLKLSVPNGGGFSFNYSESRGFTASFEVNITNGGFYPLVLDLSTVAFTGQGPLVPYTSTGAVTIAPGNRTTTFGLTLQVPEATLAAQGARLLTNDTPVAGYLWLNGSYAWIYQFGLHVAANGTWGAPFENLTVRPGAPTTAGGQVTVPVSIQFRDNALFPDAGNLTFQVTNGGTNCGPPAILPLDTPSHQNFTGEVNLTGPSSCMVPGASVTTSYSLGTEVLSLGSTRLG